MPILLGRSVMLTAFFFTSAFSLPVFAQSASGPVIVQPGAPGQPTKRLPSSTRPKLPPTSPKDIEFMQGMIMHHAQAVEMTALIDSHTDNKELKTLGARISRSQSDEIKFMERWLSVRGEPTTMQMNEMHGGMSKHQGHQMPGHQMSTSNEKLLMPGMLSKAQMDALRNAKGKEFDRLFLTGMIQHHNGALVMVKQLFDTASAGQDAELFNFVTDVDSGQRAEIRAMEKLLAEGPMSKVPSPKSHFRVLLC